MSYASTTITAASHPKQWALIKQAFPGYKKRKALMIETESTTLSGRYWSDGSKSNYATIDANGCKGVSLVCDRQDYPFTAPDAVVDLMDGTKVVQCGVFCGKPGQAYLYMKPEVTDEARETTRTTQQGRPSPSTSRRWLVGDKQRHRQDAV